MKFSIVIPTLGRNFQVDELLNSLSEIKNIEHEIIIIDQNFNNILDVVVEKYSEYYQIIHKKVDFRSLSKARNIGIKYASGEYICFPDDDSKLFSETITIALQIFGKNPEIDVVFGKCIDENGNDSVMKFNKEASFLTLKNFEGKFIEATMFAKTKILKQMKFDENLGIGAFHGAEEGYDLVYRLLKQNYCLYYTPQIKIYHPQSIQNYTDFSALKRVFEYRKGFSYLCIKHRFKIKLIQRIVLVCCAIPYTFLFSRTKTRFYCAELLGIMTGIVVRK